MDIDSVNVYFTVVQYLFQHFYLLNSVVVAIVLLSLGQTIILYFQNIYIYDKVVMQPLRGPPPHTTSLSRSILGNLERLRKK